MQLFSVKEAAERWGISEVWLRELCRKGRVALCDKVGGTWLIYGNSVILDPHERHEFKADKARRNVVAREKPRI